jgi:hypothetical protein
MLDALSTAAATSMGGAGDGGEQKKKSNKVRFTPWRGSLPATAPAHHDCGLCLLSTLRRH